MKVDECDYYCVRFEVTFRRTSCALLSALRLHFQSCWNTHIHASWIEATFRHSSRRAFIDVFAWYAERFTDVSILLARRIKTARYSTTISVYLIFLSSPSPRFSNCFSCFFYSLFHLPRLVTNEIFQRNSREHPGERSRFAIETSRHKM